jgi:tryptophan synthase alpha chain
MNSKTSLASGNRLDSRLLALRDAGRKALITYVTAGDPEPRQTAAILHELVRAGADVVELGIPFSDPMAEGPVIQHAMERALAAGTRLADVFAIVREFREQDQITPLVLMTYLNPIEAIGNDAFAMAAAAAGADAVLVVDLPPEEAADLHGALRERALTQIFLVSPTTADDRLDRINQLAGGFLYYVAVKGVTGSGTIDQTAVAARVAELRRHFALPIGVGFAVHDAATAAAMAGASDAVIVGSAIIQCLEQHAEPAARAGAIATFVGGLRRAIDGIAPGAIREQHR